MKRMTMLVTLSILLVASACSNNQGKPNGKQEHSYEMPEMIEVHIQTQAEAMDPGIPITIQAIVTQSSEPVNDADEVTFEIWKQGEDEREMVEGTLAGDGVYAIEKTFEQEGIYYVVSHVTARDMHNMPREKLNIGNVEDHGHDEEAHDHDHDQDREDSGHADGDHGNDHGHDHEPIEPAE